MSKTFKKLEDKIFKPDSNADVDGDGDDGGNAKEDNDDSNDSDKMTGANPKP